MGLFWWRVGGLVMYIAGSTGGEEENRDEKGKRGDLGRTLEDEG